MAEKRVNRTPAIRAALRSIADHVDGGGLVLVPEGISLANLVAASRWIRAQAGAEPTVVPAVAPVPAAAPAAAPVPAAPALVASDEPSPDAPTSDAPPPLASNACGAPGCPECDPEPADRDGGPDPDAAPAGPAPVITYADPEPAAFSGPGLPGGLADPLANV
jgi:hypothetical protein